ncbi:uncharacterized protein VP01_406g2 [Puccinia sorghi]|uniref:Uncharacterized protein n=1 Tax=Puccinia sorghi TaxID=27349 RepID=A0A0L6URH7_9BASI|nr:uncharacterized protein VP01_406g2 [Puccinia sorghi]
MGLSARQTAEINHLPMFLQSPYRIFQPYLILIVHHDHKLVDILIWIHLRKGTLARISLPGKASATGDFLGTFGCWDVSKPSGAILFGRQAPSYTLCDYCSLKRPILQLGRYSLPPSHSLHSARKIACTNPHSLQHLQSLHSETAQQKADHNIELCAPVDRREGPIERWLATPWGTSLSQLSSAYSHQQSSQVVQALQLVLFLLGWMQGAIGSGSMLHCNSSYINRLVSHLQPSLNTIINACGCMGLPTIGPVINNIFSQMSQIMQSFAGIVFHVCPPLQKKNSLNCLQLTCSMLYHCAYCIKAWLNHSWRKVGVRTEVSREFLHVNYRQLSNFFLQCLHLSCCLFYPMVSFSSVAFPKTLPSFQSFIQQSLPASRGGQTKCEHSGIRTHARRLANLVEQPEASALDHSAIWSERVCETIIHRSKNRNVAICSSAEVGALFLHTPRWRLLSGLKGWFFEGCRLILLTFPAVSMPWLKWSSICRRIKISALNEMVFSIEEYQSRSLLLQGSRELIRAVEV